MTLGPPRLSAFVAELRRRHVFRVAVVYGLVAFTIAQAAAIAFPALRLPDWTLTFVVAVAILGFPVAVVLAWSFEMTPEGMTRTPPQRGAGGSELRAEPPAADSGGAEGAGVSAAVPVSPYGSVPSSGSGAATDPAVAPASGPAVAAASSPAPASSPSSATTSESGPETASVSDPRTAAASEVRSIAVLPFVDMSPQGDHEYLSDGITEELLNALSRVRRLRVPARTSSFAFKGHSIDIREIGERLNVETVLEGSVRRAGNRLRVTAQLVNVADGYHLWSERYDREMEDSFAIQDDIARRIVDALEVTLSDREQRAIRTTPTRNVRAYEYYLRGRQFFHQLRRRTLQFAEQMFTRAIEADPEYAPAYAGLADVLSYLYLWFGHDEEVLRRAERASARAVELDPDLSEARASRGHCLSLDGRYEEAEREFETALRLDPRLFEAHYYFGRVCLAQGKLEQARRLFEEAGRVRPEDYQSVCLLAMVCHGLGRRDEARAVARRALAVIEEHLALNPDDARALYMGSSSLVDLGQPDRAREWAARALAIDSDDAGVLYNVACTYAKLGDAEAALGTLERAVEIGAADRAWIEHDPDLADLRDHPRFRALVEEL